MNDSVTMVFSGEEVAAILGEYVARKTGMPHGNFDVVMDSTFDPQNEKLVEARVKVTRTGEAR